MHIKVIQMEPARGDAAVAAAVKGDFCFSEVINRLVFHWHACVNAPGDNFNGVYPLPSAITKEVLFVHPSHMCCWLQLVVQAYQPLTL